MKESKLKKVISRMDVVLVIFTLALLTVATLYYIEVRELPQPESNLLFIQPCYWAIFVCSVIVIGKELLTGIRAIRSESDKKTDDAEENPKAKKDINFRAFLREHKEIILMAFAALYLCVLKTLGFIVATFLFLIVVLYIVGAANRKIWKVILVSAIIVAVLYLAFSVALQVRLPKGIL